MLPDDLDALGDDTRFNTRIYSPTLGRNTLFDQNFNAGNSSKPLALSIVNIRRSNGDPAPELTNTYPVKVWKKQYTGEEKTLAEIEEKRAIEYRPAFEIQKHSGNFNMWNIGPNESIKTEPDSGYIFDVEVSNSGGRRYERGLKLKPQKARPYEPSIYHPVSGVAPNSFVFPNRMILMYSDRDMSFVNPSSVHIFFTKDVDNKAPGSTLTFSFVDSVNNYVDPMKFNQVKWEELIHGFNHRFVGKKVVYDVAYPMPLVALPTKYTTADGLKASVFFSFDRIGYAGLRDIGGVGLDFAIFEEGHWEIQFRFTEALPKFENEQ